MPNAYEKQCTVLGASRDVKMTKTTQALAPRKPPCKPLGQNEVQCLWNLDKNRAQVVPNNADAISAKELT